MAIFQLVYSSMAKSIITADVIKDILNSAKPFNKAEEITGMLMFHSGIFVQILEGEKEKVISLFNKIKKDDRHQGVLIIVQRETSKRIFDDWSMAYCKIEPIDMMIINDIISWKHFIGGEDVDDELVFRFLQRFKEYKQL